MKKILKVTLIAIFVTFVGISFYISQKSVFVSDLALANIEALAWGELPEVTVTCDSDPGRCWIVSGLICMHYGKIWYKCERVSNTSATCSTPCD